MSLARKCDRCYTLYEIIPGCGRLNFTIVERLHDNDDGWTEDRDGSADLCLSCTEAVRNFLTPSPPPPPKPT